MMIPISCLCSLSLFCPLHFNAIHCTVLLSHNHNIIQILTSLTFTVKCKAKAAKVKRRGEDEKKKTIKNCSLESVYDESVPPWTQIPNFTQLTNAVGCRQHRDSTYRIILPSLLQDTGCTNVVSEEWD